MTQAGAPEEFDGHALHAACIASHSNAVAVYPSHRHLSGDLIRAIAADGGVIGMDYTIRDLPIGALRGARPGRPLGPGRLPTPAVALPSRRAGAKDLPNPTERLLTRGVWSSSC